MENYKVLIIDDNEPHISSLGDGLKKYGFAEANIFPYKKDDRITLATTIFTFAQKNQYFNIFKYVSQLITEKNIDVIFLDLNHCTTDSNDSPPNSSGESLVLNLIKNKIFEKLPIFIYTTYAQNDLFLNPDVSKHVGQNGLIYMKESNFSNGDEVYGILNPLMHPTRLKRKINDYHSTKYRCNLAVVTALLEEAKHIDKLSKKWTPIPGTSYKTTWLYDDSTQKSIYVIAQCIGKMGMVAASAYSSLIIQRYKPQYIAMSGICAGIDNTKLNYGDILIPHQVWNWQAGKFKTIENSEESAFDRDYNSYGPNGILNDYITTLISNSDSFIKDIVNHYKQSDKPADCLYKDSPKICKNYMVSGSSVVADKKITSQNMFERNLLGVDMEAYGVFEASSHFQDVNAVVIKSVCDFADETKDDRYHDFSSYMSAMILYKLFMHYVDF